LIETQRNSRTATAVAVAPTTRTTVHGSKRRPRELPPRWRIFKLLAAHARSPSESRHSVGRGSMTNCLRRITVRAVAVGGRNVAEPRRRRGVRLTVCWRWNNKNYIIIYIILLLFYLLLRYECLWRSRTETIIFDVFTVCLSLLYYKGIIGTRQTIVSDIMISSNWLKYWLKALPVQLLFKTAPSFFYFCNSWFCLL